MDTSFFKRLALLLLGLFIVVFIVVQIARLFGGDDEANETTTSENDPEGRRTINNITSGSSVRLDMDGKIVADENHRSIRITVTPSSRRIDVFKGYQESTVVTKSYSNNSSAFREFMFALDQAGFTKEDEDPRHTDKNGVCSSGRRYTFILKDTGDTISDLWDTSCSTGDGTFGGKASDVLRLFKRQIPDYDELTDDINL